MIKENMVKNRFYSYIKKVYLLGGDRFEDEEAAKESG